MRTGEISLARSGADVIVEWIIDGFLLKTVAFSSPDFTIRGRTWNLEIIPNGYAGPLTSGRVVLRLWKCYGTSIIQEFSLSLKTVIGEKEKEQYFTNEFKERGEKSDKYCEFHILHKRELSYRRAELVPGGVLTVVCTMKNTSSAGSNKGNHPEHASVKASIQTQEESTQTVEASIQTVEASIQTVEESTQTMEEYIHAAGESTQAAGESTQTVEESIQTVEEKCEACSSGFFTNPEEKKALHDFKELFLKKQDCDITIIVKGSEFPAHRLILRARSPVFASTFQHDMKEKATSVLEIDDCDPSSFSDFLCFIYSANVPMITQKNVFDLFTLANKYQILDLRAMSLEFIKNNLTVDTFCETITLALRHSETELIKLGTNYFTMNAPKIIVTIKWQMFLAENPTESNELLVKLLVPNSS